VQQERRSFSEHLATLYFSSILCKIWLQCGDITQLQKK